MSRLVLIDGNAILHRAYHALPHMSNSSGQATNAIYGFVSMLLSVINELKPTHLVVAFDRPGPTFRNELYKKYQAQRPKMEDELASQVDLVHEVVSALHIPIFEKDGYEADDIIASLATQASEISNFQFPISNKNPNIKISKSKQKDDYEFKDIIVVTGDRDLLQLVNEKVKLYMPVKGLSEAKLYGEKEAIDRMGVPPSQVADLKALMGDPSDNYPGVDGIGPKTAINLLQQFKTLDGIYNNLAKIGKFGVIEKLKDHKEDAFMSQKLARVVIDAPVSFDPSIAQLQKDLLTQEIIELFGKLEFKTLLKRLSKLSGREASTDPRFRKDDINKNNKNKPDERQMGLF